LKSAGGTPLAIKNCPAGLSLPMLPAGEIWSVVTLSPSTASARAPAIERSSGTSRVIPTK
jgi:hypothetical protein